MRQNWIYFLFILFFFFNCKTKEEVSHSNQPNIILFYADDLGWMDLSIQGSKYYETPNIDRIGLEGMRFTNAYANAANCAPSRACLMTGMYSPRHGIYTVGNPDRGKSENRKIISVKNTTVLDTSFLTMPVYLKSKGYQTVIAGKWHLSKDPLDYGFDANFGGFQAGHPKSYFSPYKNPYLEDGEEGEYLPERLSTELSNWMKRHKEDPFFMYFPLYSVHTPIQAKAELIEKYDNKEPEEYHNKPAYAAMIEAMDQAVGRVLHTLEELELAENTLVIFTSDNGAHDGQTLSRPLRGSKGMYYEGGIRVPFLVKYPGVIEKGTQNDTPIIGSDLFPTFIELTDGKLSENFDGKSLLNVFKGTELEPRSLFWHFPAYLQMYKNSRAFEDSHDKPWFRTAPVGVIRKGDWKLLEFFENGDLELYNLKEDIGERNNQVEENPEKTNELLEDLRKWRKEVNAPVPTELNSEYQNK